MLTQLPNLTRQARQGARWVATFAVMLWSGCASGPLAKTLLGPAFQPANVYRLTPQLPSAVRRVAVLPTSVADEDWLAAAGRAQLEPVLYTELGKANRFELIAVSAQQLLDWTGRGSWKAEDKLPGDLLGRVRESLGCDAVLFSHLRLFHAYKPLVIGWNFKLADCRSGQILWAADEVFDAADPTVARAAERYGQSHGEEWRPWGGEAGTILSSPRRFGQYTVSALLASLPKR